MWTEARDGAGDGDAIPTAVCWGCMPGPGVVIETTCWATEECKAGVAANTGAAAEERGGMTGLGRATAKGLDKTGKMVDEHSTGVGVPAANLIVARAEPRAGVRVAAGETRVGTLPNRGGDETRVGVPTGGDTKLPACAAGSRGSADTTFVLLGDHVEPNVPVSRTGVRFGVVARNDGPTAGVHAAKGELITGTPGILAGDWGKTGARGATVT